MRLLLGLGLFGLLAAGCLTPNLAPVGVPAGNLPLDASIAGPDALPCVSSDVRLDATSDNLNTLSSTNYLQVAPPGPGVPHNRHGELDASGDWLLSMRPDEGGFEVVNVADPTNITHASRFDPELRETSHDVKWMPDHKSAVVGMNRRVILVDMRPVLDSDVPLAEMMEEEVFPVEVTAWHHPLAQPLQTNMHMLATARISGIDYVFIAPNDNLGVMVIKLVGTEASRTFETVGIIGLPLTGGPIGPHDMSIVQDELLDIPILYVANGFEGWLAYDVSDPAAPTLLAAVPNAEPGYLHTAHGHLVGDRRLVVTIHEIGVNIMKIFDATDFRTPILLATWSAEATDPTPPLHNFQVVDGRLYMAHYRQGFFIFDLNALGDTPVAASLDLRPIAHWQPPAVSKVFVRAADYKDVWDVVVHRGVLFVSDIDSGAYAVQFGCLRMGEKDATSKN